MLLEGLFICGRNESIPLKSLSVRAFLQGYVVGFRSTLVYENNTSNPLEVYFRTPVDDSYAVVGLEACIDGRKIQAKVEEKEKAKEMYQEAISSGRTAAFGEEKQGDIFSLVLGNLPPGEKASIQLTMVGELGVESDGAVRFVLPTVLKPRYTPAGSDDPLAPANPTASNMVRQVTGPPEYAFDMVINGASSIAEVTSPSHRIHVENTGLNINVSLAEDKNTDIVILVRPNEAHKPLVIIEPGFSNGENDFQKSTVVMVSFFPEFKGDSSCLEAACEFVFVVDRSGSMAGSYIKDAAQTLQLFLKSIPEGCYFNIIGFGSSYEKLFPKSVPYNQNSLKTATKHAKNLQANLGGTELFDPLKYVFSHAPMKGLPRQVFVLTDGSVSNTESVIKLVAKNSTHSRCFSFGIGSGASSTLVKGIAEAGKGTAEFITSGERMQPKVIRSLKKAMQPAVTGTEISYSLPDGVTVNAIPKSSLPVFVGERLIVYGILHQSSQCTSPQEGSITLTGDLLGAKIEHTLKFHVPLAVTKDGVSQVSTIHHLTAKKLIKEMECDDGGPEMIKLSCESNVISSQTAFIAIDEERKETVKGSLQKWDIFSPPEDLDEYYDIRAKVFPFPSPKSASHSSPWSGFLVQDRSATLEFSQSTYCSSASYVPPPTRKCLAPIRSAVAKFCDDDTDSEEDDCDLSASSPSHEFDVSNTKNFGDPNTSSIAPLSRIITLQLASCEWKMTSDLADVIKKSVTEIQNACPVPCKGEMETIWATTIVLAYLRIRQSQFKDEWELVAMKGEAWLGRQHFVEGCSVQSLSEKASEFLA